MCKKAQGLRVHIPRWKSLQTGFAPSSSLCIHTHRSPRGQLPRRKSRHSYGDGIRWLIMRIMDLMHSRHPYQQMIQIATSGRAVISSLKNLFYRFRCAFASWCKCESKSLLLTRRRVANHYLSYSWRWWQRNRSSVASGCRRWRVYILRLWCTLDLLSRLSGTFRSRWRWRLGCWWL